jgi:hypothetical protein
MSLVTATETLNDQNGDASAMRDLLWELCDRSFCVSHSYDPGERCKRIGMVESCAWNGCVPHLVNAILDAHLESIAHEPDESPEGQRDHLEFWCAGFRRFTLGRKGDDFLPATSQWYALRRRMVQHMPAKLLADESRRGYLWLSALWFSITPLHSNFVSELYERFPHLIVDSDFVPDHRPHPAPSSKFCLALSKGHAIRNQNYISPLAVLCLQFPLSGVAPLIPLLLSFLGLPPPIKV